MKRTRCTEEQIAFALRQAEGGTAVEEICRRMGVSEATCLMLEEVRWDGGSRGPMIEAARGRRALVRHRSEDDGKRKLKKLVTDLSLDRSMLQDALP